MTKIAGILPGDFSLVFLHSYAILVHIFEIRGIMMDYNLLLDLVTDIGYELALSGAETYRVEESVNRILGSYGISSEVFAIPNCLTVSIETPEGKPMTRMRRIGFHGNDLDAVERFSGLSRAICNRKPTPEDARQWLDQVRSMARVYSMPMYLLGDFLGAAGFGVFFGGNLVDGLCAGICGILVGLVSKFMDRLKANPFFSTISSSFLMALLAYSLGALGIAHNPDMVTIGALMILVPGLLFTNAMRDIIYGDTNSGTNRIVQVLLIAAAIALGTAAAWSASSAFFGTPVGVPTLENSAASQCLAALVGCIGFAILFNVHGPGVLLCVLGGTLTWAAYLAAFEISGSSLAAFFWSALFASFYSEIMARIRKYPAISYLVVSIFPLIPGAGVYYTMNYAVRGDMSMFASKGMHTAATAGLIAVGILLVSTAFRMLAEWKVMRKK